MRLGYVNPLAHGTWLGREPGQETGLRGPGPPMAIPRFWTDLFISRPFPSIELRLAPPSPNSCKFFTASSLYPYPSFKEDPSTSLKQFPQNEAWKPQLACKYATLEHILVVIRGAQCGTRCQVPRQSVTVKLEPCGYRRAS